MEKVKENCSITWGVYIFSIYAKNIKSGKSQIGSCSFN